MRPVLYQGVDHRITDEKDPLIIDTSLPQPCICVFTSCEKTVSDRISHHAVDFLGHSPVTRTNARLNVSDGDA